MLCKLFEGGDDFERRHHFYFIYDSSKNEKTRDFDRKYAKLEDYNLLKVEFC